MQPDIRVKAENYITITEAAELLGKHRSSLYNWRKRGLITFTKMGRYTMVSRAEVDRLKKEMGKNE